MFLVGTIVCFRYMANILIDSFSEANQDDAYGVGITTKYVGQSFLNTSRRLLTGAKFYLKKTGSPTGNGVAKLYAHTGTFGTNSGMPTGAALATSDNFDVSTLTTSYGLAELTFSGANRVVLQPGTHYCIVFYWGDGDVSNYLAIGIDISSPSHAGSNIYSSDGSTWVSQSLYDTVFYVYGTPALLPYEDYSSGDDTTIDDIYSGYWEAMTFTPSVSHILRGVKLSLLKEGTPSETITVSIRATDVDGKPTGSDLCSSTLNSSALTSSAAWYEFSMGDGVSVSASTKYAIVFRMANGNGTSCVNSRVKGSGAYSGGQRVYSSDSGANWTTTSQDLMFVEYGTPIITEYENYDTNDDDSAQMQGANWKAQTFTPAVSHIIKSVSLKIYKVGSPGTLTVSIRGVDGDGFPTGSDLVSGTLNADNITTSTNGDFYEISFSTAPLLTASTKYAIVGRCTGGDASNRVQWKIDTASGSLYSGGQYCSSTDSGSSWIGATDDFLFQEWGDPAVLPLSVNDTVSVSESFWGSNISKTRFEFYSAADDNHISIPVSVAAAGMQFTPSISHRITSVKMKLFREASPGTVTIEIFAVDGSGFPTGSALASGTTNSNTLPATAGAAEWREIDLGAGALLIASTMYVIKLTAPSGDSGNYVRWRRYDSGTYSGGQLITYNGSWSNGEVDAMFEEWGYATVFPSTVDSVSVSESVSLDINPRTARFYPDSTPELYEEYTTDNDSATFYDDRERGQTFTLDANKTIKSIKVKLSKVGSPTGNLTLTLKATSSGLPTGSALATATIDVSTLTGTATLYEFVLGTPYAATAGVYCFYLTPDAGGTDSGNAPKYHYDNAAGYSDGASIYTESGSWYQDTARDWHFKVYVVAQTVDGLATQEGDYTYSAIVAAAGGSAAANSSTQFNSVFLRANTTSSHYDRLDRGIFVINATTFSGNPNSVSEVRFGMCVREISDQLGGAQKISLVSSNPAANNDIVAGDYDSLGTTKYATDIAISELVDEQYVVFTLNAAGISFVKTALSSGGGIIKLGTRLASEFDGVSDAPTWGSAETVMVSVNAADYGSNKPYLDIVYYTIFNPSVSDSITVSENISLSIVSGNTYNQEVSDSITVLESVSLFIPNINNLSYESVSVSEDISLLIASLKISVFETVNVSEDNIILIPVLWVDTIDSVSVSESINVIVTVIWAFCSDSIFVSEFLSISSSLILISVQDSISINDNVGFSIPILFFDVFDSALVTEVVDFLVPVLPILAFDSLNLGEFISIRQFFSVNVYDSLTISENVLFNILLIIGVSSTISVSENVSIDVIRAGRLFPNVPRGNIAASQGLFAGGMVGTSSWQGNTYNDQGLFAGGRSPGPY